MELDEVDRGILYLLQRDARRITTEEMGERVGVAASTVRNRIANLEAEGIVRGYRPDVDYNEAGLPLHLLFICSAPNPERGPLAEAARDVDGVVRIYEVLNGTDNVQIEAVGTDTDDMARINDELSATGLDVVTSKVIKSHHVQPFDHFGNQVAEGS